ncbi:hypothetical protein MA13_contig00001-0391 [Edwardsiella piscicida]|uniref:Uncharacterized protein n=1 Tax=Edwardsiella anguillarum ET080813 TaxID=667120 RepID=A0A076LLR6_9GAMM|nr:Hypothetical protein ETEE_0124 [Edwardsiella anguillarum ET080813]GAJ66268.1 hypothetical protein MA13_contig00001-0391 [Edwardsiella piscicida]
MGYQWGIRNQALIKGGQLLAGFIWHINLIPPLRIGMTESVGDKRRGDSGV